MTAPDPVARRFAELRSRVAEQLHAHELFLSAVWVSRATARPSAGEVARSELGPKRLLESMAAEAVGVDQAGTGPNAYAEDRRGILDGAPGSLAGELDRQVAEPVNARVLALTDQRLLVLAKAAPPRSAPERPRTWLARTAKGVGDLVGDLIRNEPDNAPLPPLVPIWACPRSAILTAAEQAGKLRVSFADGSSLVLVTPSSLTAPFVAAVSEF